MSTENLVDNYLSNRNNNTGHLSDLLNNLEGDNNDNNQEISTTESNNTETESSSHSISIDSKNKPDNFIEKKNSENNIPPMIPKGPQDIYRIEGLKFFKAFDNYFLETSTTQCWDTENQRYFIKKSKNYLPKNRIFGCPKDEMNLSLQFYYKIKTNDRLHCIYYDQYFRPHKYNYDLISNS